MNNEIKNRISKEFLKEFNQKYLQKRFEKSYAYSTLNFRKRAPLHKGNKIIYKTGATKNQLFATLRIDASGNIKFDIPNYTKAKSWKVPYFIYQRNPQIQKLLEKIEFLSFRSAYQLLRSVLGSWSAQRIYLFLKKYFTKSKKPRWFNTQKSVAEELSTITNSEINSICKSISEKQLTFE